MCGIYGIVGDAGKNKLALARALCVLNTSRGEHSAGIATSGADLTTELFKSAIHPYRFARRKEFARMSSADYRVLIGHTRFATHGSISDENAHPFKIGATVGVHNGVVGNVAGMSQYTGKTFPVDSQYLIYCLDKFGHLGPAQGSLNVAYFGRKDAADLRIIRCGNPLGYTVVNNGRALVFSSEWEHLEMALAIAGIKGQVWDFPKDCAASVTIGKDGKVVETLEEIPILPDDMAMQYRTKSTILNWYDFPIPSQRGKTANKPTSKADTTECQDTCHDAETESAWRDWELRDRIERDDWKELQRQEEEELWGKDGE